MTLNMPVVELERRLSTERVLDIFTMQPKVGIIPHSNAKCLTKHCTDLFSFSNSAMPTPNEPSRPSIYPSYSVFGRCRHPLRTQGDWAGSLYTAGPHFFANGPVPRVRADVGCGKGYLWT
jgi:hypothetical protein